MYIYNFKLSYYNKGEVFYGLKVVVSTEPNYDIDELIKYKETIISLASKLQNGNMKDEKALKEVIGTLSKMTGREVSKEQEEKIINAVVNDKVPKNLDEYYK